MATTTRATKKHPDGVSIIINGEDALDIQADIQGPKQTPYEGGLFRVKIVIGGDFPQVAPKGYFITKIYHPNVSDKGEICVNTLKKDWNPKQWSLFHVLEVIKCLLIIPFPESSLNQEAGKLFMENYNEYFKIAKIFTKVHATCKMDVEERETHVETVVNTPLSEVEVTDRLNFNLLKHSKSMNVNLKSDKKENRESNVSNLDNVDNGNENKNKPNLSNLPFIVRAKSNNFAVPTMSDTRNSQPLPKSVGSSSSIFGGVPTPSSKIKRDEIKKWLSRL